MVSLHTRWWWFWHFTVCVFAKLSCSTPKFENFKNACIHSYHHKHCIKTFKVVLLFVWIKPLPNKSLLTEKIFLQILDLVWIKLVLFCKICFWKKKKKNRKDQKNRNGCGAPFWPKLGSSARPTPGPRTQPLPPRADKWTLPAMSPLTSLLVPQISDEEPWPGRSPWL
jgi:hypothetical protein